MNETQALFPAVTLTTRGTAALLSLFRDLVDSRVHTGNSESFHPQVAQPVSGSSLADETRKLLRLRLTAVGSILALFLLLMSVRSFVVVQAEGMRSLNLLLLVIAVGLIAVLRSRLDLTLRMLRSVEIFLIGSAAILVTLNRFLLVNRLALEGNLEQVSDFLGRSILPYVILILIYGIALPNSWRRAAWVVIPVSLIPLALHVTVALSHPELGFLLTLERVSSVIFPTGLTVAAALYGAHTYHSLRVAAFKARQLGHYQLIEKIGTGGMGNVWRASHRLLARPAAIKVIRPDVLGARGEESQRLVLARFEREAHATAALTSPHAVMLYDFGISSEGAFYYVMELLDGYDLGTLIDRFGPQSAGRTIHLLLQVCEALTDAHYHGLIHRDIKPSNVFSCRKGRICDFVKVLDFGLVQNHAESSEDVTRLTVLGTVTGTPAFIAPEQAVGESVDARTDIYSLGCVGYWMLTGCLVFEEENPTAMLVEHVKSRPVAPSERVEQSIPADLESVILHCLEKRPEDRPKSAEELSKMLLACESSEDWGTDKAWQWWKIHSPSSFDENE